MARLLFFQIFIIIFLFTFVPTIALGPPQMRNATLSYTAIARLTPLNKGQPPIGYGESVLLANRTAYVGAPSPDGDSINRPVDVYSRDRTGWKEPSFAVQSNVPTHVGQSHKYGEVIVSAYDLNGVEYLFVGAPGANYIAVYKFEGGVAYNISTIFPPLDYSGVGFGSAVAAMLILPPDDAPDPPKNVFHIAIGTNNNTVYYTVLDLENENAVVHLGIIHSGSGPSNFGFSIDARDPYFLISSPQTSQVVVYKFQPPPTNSFELEQTINGLPESDFGYAIKWIDHAQFVVTAPKMNSVYIYALSPGGQFEETPSESILPVPGFKGNPANSTHFGRTIGVGNNILLVGGSFKSEHSDIGYVALYWRPNATSSYRPAAAPLMHPSVTNGPVSNVTKSDYGFSVHCRNYLCIIGDPSTVSADVFLFVPVDASVDGDLNIPEDAYFNNANITNRGDLQIGSSSNDNDFDTESGPDTSQTTPESETRAGTEIIESGTEEEDDDDSSLKVESDGSEVTVEGNVYQGKNTEVVLVESQLTVEQDLISEGDETNVEDSIVEVGGDANFDNTVLILSTTQFEVDGDFVISSTETAFSDTVISVGSCISIDGGQITVDLNSYDLEEGAEELVLATSSISCVSVGDEPLLVVNGLSDCQAAQLSTTGSLSILFSNPCEDGVDDSADGNVDSDEGNDDMGDDSANDIANDSANDSADGNVDSDEGNDDMGDDSNSDGVFDGNIADIEDSIDSTDSIDGDSIDNEDRENDTDNNDLTGYSGLSPLTMVGLVIAALFFALITGVVVYFMYNRRQNQMSKQLRPRFN
eukprot:TRINITY_DN1226_c0_g1_i1.p1 TRINITY_DN1226_c0_g1~~TRINITY_DN1226_c0_g1_i1.p1  ORF type:complete len:821 (-),score=235.26 TRINITY_DN1226_c0_g1_i1:276-2711(-)